VFSAGARTPITERATAKANVINDHSRGSDRHVSSEQPLRREGADAKEPLPMNVLLWVVQVALALLSVAGGAYKVFSFDELAKMPAMGALSRSVWGALGAFEMLCAVLLVVPASKRMRFLTPLAAAALALESLALAGLYARYSLEVTTTNPLVWVIVMALMAALVAYGRYVLRPQA
jgi:hypothetical protein